MEATDYMTIEEDILRSERDDALMRLDQAVRKISRLEDEVGRLEDEIAHLEERLEEGGDPEFLRMIQKLARKRDFAEIEEQVGRRVGF